MSYPKFSVSTECLLASSWHPFRNFKSLSYPFSFSSRLNTLSFHNFSFMDLHFQSLNHPQSSFSLVLSMLHISCSPGFHILTSKSKSDIFCMQSLWAITQSHCYSCIIPWLWRTVIGPPVTFIHESKLRKLWNSHVLTIIIITMTLFQQRKYCPYEEKLNVDIGSHQFTTITENRIMIVKSSHSLNVTTSNLFAVIIKWTP